jgi:hypothetical protein
MTVIESIRLLTEIFQKDPNVVIQVYELGFDF